MIRNIVFDMGNVVIRFDPVYFLDRAGITDPEDRKLVLNELFHLFAVDGNAEIKILIQR